MARTILPRQLILRIVSALIMAPIALAAVYGGELWLALLVFLVGIVGTYEWNRMAKIDLPPIFAINGLVYVSSLLAYHYHSALLSAEILVGGAIICGLTSKLLKHSFGWAFWGQFYIGLAVLSVVWLRDVYGWQAVIWLLLVIWSMDIGAYFAGSTIGGPKLAPRASPNKTWAGLIGGLMAATLVSVFAGQWLGVSTTIVLALTGLLFAFWSQLGDLVESQIKRHFDVRATQPLFQFVVEVFSANDRHTGFEFERLFNQVSNIVVGCQCSQGEPVLMLPD